MNQQRLMLFFLVFFFGVTIAGVLDSVVGYRGAAGVLGSSSDISVSQLLAETNLARTQAEISPLMPTEALHRAAQAKADDMIARMYWSHTSEDNITPWSFIAQEGYVYELAGENLARNFISSPNIVLAWLESPSHRANLLSPDYIQTGIGISYGVDEDGAPTVVIVQFMARPVSTIGATRTLPPELVELALLEPKNQMRWSLLVLGGMGVLLSVTALGLISDLRYSRRLKKL